MQSIPAEVKEYLSSNDSLLRADLARRYPNLNETLNDPNTRSAVLAWLAANDAFDEGSAHFAINCLKYLQGKASSDESQIVRTFLLHPNPQVRLAAYENLLTLYFPDKNPEALLQLLQNMFSDSDETIRIEAARYAKQAGAGAELKGFLQRWRQLAAAQGWENFESVELVDQLLGEE